MNFKGSRTEKNLLAAFAGESQARNRYTYFASAAKNEGEKLEWGTLYPGFAKIAEEEGFSNVAESFTEVGEVEQFHERRYRMLLENVEEGSVFRI
jgi:rubrerythrin